MVGASDVWSAVKETVRPVLLAGRADDERYVDDRPGQIGAAMLEDAALKTFSMIGGHDDGCILQFPGGFQPPT